MSDIIKIIFLLSFHDLCAYISALAQDEISKELFPRVSVRGLHWEYKVYKLKRKEDF